MSRQTRFASARVLGLEIDAMTIAEAVDHIVSLASDASTAPRYVVKPYVEFFPVALRKPEIMRILDEAELCLADGVALQWAAAYGPGRRSATTLLCSLGMILVAPERLRVPIPERHGGANFTERLLERCAERGLGVHLVGSPRRNSIDATARHLAERMPGLRITGTFTGRLTPQLEEELVGELRSTRPNVVLVGMGFPRQEELMARLIPRIDHGVLIGEGGTFDYREFGGAIRRAPRFMQRAGVEWLWRLGHEPSRLGRQMAIPRFIREVYRERPATTSR